MIFKVFQPKTLYNLFLILLFSSLALTGALHHELWVDEARAWLIAKEMPLDQLQNYLAYEKSPPMWYWILKLVHSIYTDVGAIQMTSMLMGILSFIILVICSPFTKIQKFLLAFNYYLLYEYTVISRGYCLEILLLFILCALEDKKLKFKCSYILICLALAYTNIFGLVFSGVLILDLIAQIFLNKNYTSAKSKSSNFSYLSLYFLFTLYLVFKLQSPADAVEAVFFYNFDVTRALISFARYFESIFLIIQTTGVQWTNSVLWTSLFFQAYAPFLFLFLTYYFISKLNRRCKFLFAVTSLAFFAVNYVNIYSFDSRRHTGQLVILILVITWQQRGKLLAPNMLSNLVSLMLAFQAFSGLIAVYRDYAAPYSKAPQIALLLNSTEYKDYALLADPPFFSSSYIALTNRTFFYADQSNEIRVIKLTKNYRDSLLQESMSEETASVLNYTRPEILLNTISKHQLETLKKTLLITNYEIKNPELIEINLSKLAEYTGALNPYENFFVYKSK